MSNPDPSPELNADLDVDAEQDRLDEMGQRIEKKRRDAERDLSDRDALGDWMPDSGPQDAPTEHPEDRTDL